MTTITEINNFLSNADPLLGKIIQKCPITEIPKRSLYAEFVAAIIGQRITLTSARKSRGLLYQKLGGVRDFTPQQIIVLTADDLIKMDIDIKRSEAIIAATKFIVENDIELDKNNIHDMQKIKGIGPWTINTTLINYEDDILPPNDIALLNATKKLYSLNERPTNSEFTKIAEKWKPYRSYACMYLWKV